MRQSQTVHACTPGDRGIAIDILLIAGPSGAGKSSFIEALADRQLPSSLASRLPPGAIDWPRLEANDLLKRGSLPQLTSPDLYDSGGVILHYDTFFIRRTGLDDYTTDPITEFVVNARKLQVVCIEPAPHQLRAQFRARQNSQYKAKGLFRAAWARFVNRPAKDLRYRLFRQGRPNTCRLYRTDEEIEKCYRAWARHLTELRKLKPEMDVFCVRPVPEQATERSFSLMPSPAMTTAAV